MLLGYLHDTHRHAIESDPMLEILALDLIEAAQKIKDRINAIALGERRLNMKCSWCQQEHGERPQPNESHTICDRHRAEMLAEVELPEIVQSADVQEIYRHGHRWDQISYSATTVGIGILIGFGFGLVGITVGALVAIWRFCR